MRTAKEWAESVVSVIDADVVLEDDDGCLYIDGDQMYPSEVRDTATGIIERLVERVQADARAPLEEEIARLRQVADAARVYCATDAGDEEAYGTAEVALFDAIAALDREPT